MRICTILMLLAIFAGVSIAEQAPEQRRGVWIVRHQLKDSVAIDRLIAMASAYKFTDLFVQVRGRGDAYYNSNFEPRAEGLPADFDPLAYLIRRSEGQNFTLHAWVNVHYLWSKGRLPLAKDHLVYQQPDWLVQPLDYQPDSSDTTLKGLRGIEGLYTSPMRDSLNLFLLNVFDDILSNYPVDGLHLDYVRYPGREFDFHPETRAAFQDSFFVDPYEFSKVPEDFVARFGPTGYEVFISKWGGFLRDGLSDFIKQLSQQTRSRHPGVVISAAVKPDLGKAHWQFYQEWDRWLNEGWLDIAIPMNYTPDRKLFINRIRGMIPAIDLDKIWMGVGLYNQSPNAAVQKVLIAKELSLRGFVLFSFDTILENERFRSLYYDNVIHSVR